MTDFIYAYNLESDLNKKLNRMSEVQKNERQMEMIKEWMGKTGLVVLSEVTLSMKALLDVHEWKILGISFGPREKGRFGTYVLVDTKRFDLLKVNYIDFFQLVTQKMSTSNGTKNVAQCIRLLNTNHPIVKVKLGLRKPMGLHEKLTLYAYKAPVHASGDKCFMFNLINEVISKSDGTFKILVGDLNVRPGSNELEYLHGSQRAEGFDGRLEWLTHVIPEKPTCYNHHFKQAEILDFAMSNVLLKCRTIELGFHTRENPSDHCPICIKYIEEVEDLAEE